MKRLTSVFTYLGVWCTLCSIKAQECQIHVSSNDTIIINSIGICIDISFINSLSCFSKIQEINKYAYGRFKNQKYVYYPKNPFQVEVYDSMNQQLEPLDGNFYNELPGYYDYYILDTANYLCSFKIGIITSSYRLESYKTYKVKLLMVLEEDGQAYIHSSYTFHVTKFPLNSRKGWFKKKYMPPCYERNKIKKTK